MHRPYNVNTASEHAGLLALKHRAEIMVSVNALRAEKDVMIARIGAELSWHVLFSCGLDRLPFDVLGLF